MKSTLKLTLTAICTIAISITLNAENAIKTNEHELRMSESQSYNISNRIYRSIITEFPQLLVYPESDIAKILSDVKVQLTSKSYLQPTEPIPFPPVIREQVEKELEGIHQSSLEYLERFLLTQGFIRSGDILYRPYPDEREAEFSDVISTHIRVMSPVYNHTIRQTANHQVQTMVLSNLHPLLLGALLNSYNRKGVTIITPHAYFEQTGTNLNEYVRLDILFAENNIQIPRQDQR